ncbi:DUF6379 domain-containing protein [Novosphingobium sp. AAP83]|uniref:C-glycoside deglycosidase beta subunit domain-containing protein n=1 Tax=Novosphingobium sp. AAP83 TaxID=1523425 RepID=UPI0006B8A94C|nr:DUF6379 domain-containing protein [Novosphingobium sp. AAP83]
MFLGQMTVEDCASFAASIGAHGIEILPEQNMPSFPHITETQVGEWQDMVTRHGCQFTAYARFLRTIEEADRLGTQHLGIDGAILPCSAIMFDEGPGPLPLDQMETAFDRCWPFGASATIFIDFPGGFPSGEHALSLQQKSRISYMPFPSLNNDEKRISIC